jgi:hypothetical protein
MDITKNLGFKSGSRCGLLHLHCLCPWDFGLGVASPLSHSLHVAASLSRRVAVLIFFCQVISGATSFKHRRFIAGRERKRVSLFAQTTRIKPLVFSASFYPSMALGRWERETGNLHLQELGVMIYFCFLFFPPSSYLSLALPLRFWQRRCRAGGECGGGEWEYGLDRSLEYGVVCVVGLIELLGVQDGWINRRGNTMLFVLCFVVPFDACMLVM